MGMKENNDLGPLDTTEAVAAYEEAMREFATSAAEFMKHVGVLTKARDSYQRAMTVSAGLRNTLDKGDEILRTLMERVEHAINAQPAEEASDKRQPEVMKIQESAEKVRAAGA
jgi:hypothetical protein